MHENLEKTKQMLHENEMCEGPKQLCFISLKQMPITMGATWNCGAGRRCRLPPATGRPLPTRPPPHPARRRPAAGLGPMGPLLAPGFDIAGWMMQDAPVRFGHSQV